MLEQLPVDGFLEIIDQKLKDKGNLILSASPGAGKTTRVPAFLTQKRAGKILVLEPRRIAAVGAAQRVAEERSWKLGDQVGYQVRFENCSGEQTRLIFMTEALLARKMITDPELKDVEVVVLDEFHERSASVDITLALLKELQGLCQRPQILVMSATLDPKKIQNYLGSCDFIEVPGKLFPLEVRKSTQPLSLNLNPEFYQRIKTLILEAARSSSQDILVFLPGVGEIHRTLKNLENWIATSNFDVEILHGNISLDEQRRILKRGPRRRIILSTNIAESSITVDGVDAVVDSGLEKTSRHDDNSGFSRLILQRISLSSARQRAGRAARQKNGIALQAWSAHDEKSMSDQKVPELFRSNLSEYLLLLSHHGIRNFQTFDWFEKPELKSIQSAEKELASLELLSEEKGLTEKGKKVLNYPLPVELGALLFQFEKTDLDRWGCWFVSLLNEADHLNIKNPAEHPEGMSLACDLIYRAYEVQGLLHSHLHNNEVNYSRKQRVQNSFHSLFSRFSHSRNDYSEKNLKKTLLLAWPHRLCRQRGEGGKAISATGRGVQLASESFAKSSEFFIALQGVEGVKGADTFISWACGVSKDLVLETLSDQIFLKDDLVFDKEKDDFLLRKVRCFKKIELESPLISYPTPSQVQEQLPNYIKDNFYDLLEEQVELNNLFSRIHFLELHVNQLPEKEREMINFFRKEAWISESVELVCFNEASLRKIKEKNWLPLFQQKLSSEFSSLVKREAPEGLTLPSNKFHRLQYQKDGTVVLSARLQEFFGLKDHPRLLANQLKIHLHLLGPNYKLVQITQDLAHFWKVGYLDVRKEMRARYPKHKWPEDPS